MTETPPHNPYWQGIDRPVIQVKTDDSRWVAWNWDYAQWDVFTSKLNLWGRT